MKDATLVKVDSVFKGSLVILTPIIIHHQLISLEPSFRAHLPLGHVLVTLGDRMTARYVRS